MKSACAMLLAALVLALVSPPAASVRVQQLHKLNPLSKVVALLQSLTEKITKEGEAEDKSYKEYVEWCDDASRNSNFDIKTATTKKEKLEAEINKHTGDLGASATKTEALAVSIAADSKELKDATILRENQTAEFKKSEAELMDVIDTLSRAITLVGREMAKNPAFAQVGTQGSDKMLSALSTILDAAAFSSADNKKLLALVQASQAGSQSAEAGEDELGAPAAAVYKTHSSSILDTLEDLREKAQEELSTLRKAETRSQHNFEMLKQDLEMQVAAASKGKTEATASGQTSAELKSTAEGDLAATMKDLEDANAALKTANSGCMSVAADHEASIQRRQEELDAVAKAVKTLTSSTTGAEAQTYSLLQVAQARRSERFSLSEAALAHAALRLSSRVDLANAEVVTLVKRLAEKHRSAALAQLASQISAVLRYGSSAHEDPFAKVKGLISDMIARLEADAGAEATEKSYCDEQTAKTEEKKGELEYDISKLTAKMDQAAAGSAKLKQEVHELEEALATLAKAQAQMDKMRSETHANYLQAKEDLEEGLTGVRSAMATLRDYYQAGETPAKAAMLQDGEGLGAMMRQPVAPTLHSKAMGEGTSIIDMLEVIESDFAKGLAGEETAEADAAADYEKMTQANKVTKTLKDQDVVYKTQEFKGLDKHIQELSSDKANLNVELQAVLEFFSKLNSRCIAKPETYEERKNRREAEIQGLKEALTILEDEAAFVQHGARPGTRRP